MRSGDLSDIFSLLVGKSSLQRRKAAKKAGQSVFSAEERSKLCKALGEALWIEENTSAWEARCEIIRAIRKQLCFCLQSALFERYVKENKDCEMVSMEAVHTYLALYGDRDSAIEWIFDFIDVGSDAQIEGVLNFLGYERVVLDPEKADILINKFFNFGSNRSTGFTDPRYGLAAACAGWSGNLVESFLKSCLGSNDQPLIYVASNSLKKKYVRLR